MTAQSEALPLQPATPTEVYDTYWRFAAERQSIYFRRIENQPPPWTDDDILSTYKFTNVYRASDRVSQYLVRNVIYSGEQTPEEIFFRTILFKIFNRISTWEYFRHCVKEVTYRDYDFAFYDKLVHDLLSNKSKVFSAAYIMPSGTKEFGVKRKHQAYLAVLGRMMDDEVPLRLLDCKGMREGYELLLSYPLLGPFLAYQFTIDLSYSDAYQFSESEFVVPGPGALDGIKKCFSSTAGLSPSQIIKLVTERQDEEFAQRALPFRTLWGRPLQLIDCQNLFCEISKYARQKHPSVPGVNGRTKIKQKFRCSGPLPEPWFPPKWGLNEKIVLHMEKRSRQDGFQYLSE